MNCVRVLYRLSCHTVGRPLYNAQDKPALGPSYHSVSKIYLAPAEDSLSARGPTNRQGRDYPRIYNQPIAVKNTSDH